MVNAIRDYFRPSPNGVRTRDIVREFMNQGGFMPGVVETARQLPKDAVQFGLSAIETPGTFRRGEASGKVWDVPFFGPMESAQTETQRRYLEGQPAWKATGIPMLKTVLGGADVGAVAGMTARALRPYSAVARDLTTPMSQLFPKVQPYQRLDNGFQTTQNIIESRYPGGRPPGFESPTLQRMMRPGLTIEDVSGPVVKKRALSVGKKVSYESTGDYGNPIIVEGTIKKINPDGTFVVKSPGYSSGIDYENTFDYSPEEVTLDIDDIYGNFANPPQAKRKFFPPTKEGIAKSVEEASLRPRVSNKVRVNTNRQFSPREVESVIQKMKNKGYDWSWGSKAYVKSEPARTAFPRAITEGAPEEIKALNRNMDARQLGETLRPQQLMKTILQGKKRIPLDDAYPINPRDYDPRIGDIEQMMIDAGYRTMKDKNKTRLYGLWELKNKAAFNKFRSNPNFPEPYVPDPSIDAANKFISNDWAIPEVSNPGDANSLMEGLLSQPLRQNITPESYGDDIATEFGRSFHPAPRSFDRVKGREYTVDPKAQEIYDVLSEMSTAQTVDDKINALFRNFPDLSKTAYRRVIRIIKDNTKTVRPKFDAKAIERFFNQ